MTKTRMRPSIIATRLWMRTVGVGCQQNKDSAVTPFHSLSHDTLMVSLLISSPSRPMLTSSPASYIAEKKSQLIRKNYADIKEVYSGIADEDKAFLTLYQSKDKFSYLVGKKRKEATQQEKRQFAKQYFDAKQAECKSRFDNDVFELVDMRKLKIRNFVAGHRVLTIKKDKDGNFLKCKARWVLKGFQDRQKDTQQTDSPAVSRSGFCCATQFAANCRWDLYHMDLREDSHSARRSI